MKRRPWLFPPIWLALLISLLGIYGMNLVYLSLTAGGWLRGVIGAVLLSVAVVLVGTPLAVARYIRKQQRDQSRRREGSLK